MTHNSSSTSGSDYDNNVDAYNSSTAGETMTNNGLHQGLYHLMTDHFALFAFVIFGMITFLTVATFWIRAYCFKKFGVECCTGTVSESRRRQIREDQILAAQLQRELDQQRRETASKERQIKRRKLYEQFLNPYTKVIESGDVVARKSEHFSPNNNKRASDDTSDIEHSESTTFSADDCIIRFTIPNEEENEEKRQAEATCSICLKTYQTGDEIVFSAGVPGCSHVYHRDCMLMWLATGKKRCPVCRKGFVPSRREVTAAVGTNDTSVSSSRSTTVGATRTTTEEDSPSMQPLEYGDA